jgi:hypothetical protein
MLATSLFQVNGAAEPSSKKDRGSEAACGGPSAVLVKEVVEGPMIGMEVTMDRFVEKGSVRERVMGDIPLMESIDVAGDTPSETSDRRFRGCRVSGGSKYDASKLTYELLEASMRFSPSNSEAELPSESSSSSCM